MVELSNDLISVSIKKMGAEIVSIKKKKDEYLWQGDPNIWSGQAPNLFPIIGRLKDEEYTFNNRSYKMKIHGFAKDALFEVTEKNENYVSFLLSSSSDTYESYPFDFQLFITYELMDNVIKKQYMILNKGYKDMYYEVGGHEGFNLNFVSDRPMGKYYIEFSDASVYTYTTDENIMFNEGLTEIRLDSNKLFLDPSVFKNDALVLDTSKMKEKSIYLGTQGSKKSVKVDFEDFAYLGIWTRPYESGYICVEPWSTLPDCNYIDKDLINKVGIRKLEAQRSDLLTYTIEIN